MLMSDARAAVANAKECAVVLSAAIDTTEPHIDVYGDILRLVATFVPYCAFFTPHQVNESSIKLLR